MARLNKWADGMTDAVLKERETGDMYQRELRAERDTLRAELAALRAELESAHAAQRHAEKELSQYMAWYAMAEHQHLHEQRRAEKAEAEAARLLELIKRAPLTD